MQTLTRGQRVARGFGRAGIAAALLLSCASLLADEKTGPMSLNDQESLDQFEKLLRSIDELQAATESAAALKLSQCMKAFGNHRFCKCIANKSPVGVDFMGYINVVVATLAELKYEKLSTQNKRIVDAARDARDQCVQASTAESP